MTDSGSEYNFHVPKFIKRTLQGLLLPGQKLEDILDHLGGLISVGSDEITPDETVWGSNTMTLNNKKTKTLDMFFKKVVKTEVSDAESNCSVNSDDGTVIEGSSKKSSSSSRAGTASPEKLNKKILKTENAAVTPSVKRKPKNPKSKSSPHAVSSSDGESSEKNPRSPTYSVDLFAEETHISTDQPNKTNSEDSSSDSSNESSAKPSQKSSAGKKHSESTNTPISAQKSYKKSKTLRSLENEISEDEHNLQPTMSKLDSIKKRMKNIKQVYSEVKGDAENFSFEDLTEDDEIYILQCPTEMDPKKLKGAELNLEGNSVVSVDEQAKYDCFSMKESSKRNVYLALPDSNEQGMKLGVFPKAGNVILSENLDIPFTKPIEDDFNTYLNESRGQRTSKKKKKHRTSDGSDINFLGESQISKKKEKRICDDTQIIPDTENIETPMKTKKKKKKSMEDQDSCISDVNTFQNLETDREDSQIILDPEFQETPSKHRKKKKRSMEDFTGKENSSSEFKTVDIAETDCESQIIPDTQDQETPLKAKKKKKKHKEDTTQDEATESEYFSENVTDVLNKLASKKKKRKNLSLGNNEGTAYESDFDKFLNIKTEMEEPQLVSDFQETPSKSKKRSRKDMEDSEEFSKEGVPKKKKKKKHSLESSAED